MSKVYNDFVARMGSFDMELSDLEEDSAPTKYTKIQNGDKLQHFGILGMHWGVIRDGSTTGKRGPSEKQLTKAKTITDHASTISRAGSDITRAVSDIKNTKKGMDLSELTDDDLKYLVARMNLEQQYANLNSAQTTKGAAYARSALDIAGGTLAIGGSAVAIALGMQKLKGGG